MGGPRLRLGVAGLGRAFALMAPTLGAHPRVTLVAAADPRAEARARFAAEFGGTVHATVDALCADPGIDAIYVATPHAFHAAHAIAAAHAGKHVLVEKPMALALADCDAMIDAARAAGVALIVGPSHSSDAPVRRARELIASGTCGPLRMITALTFTDFVYRPRHADELDAAQGGGAVRNQAAHQVDVVRYLAGGLARSVRAATGAWDAARRIDGAYAAFMTFDGGVAATLTYSGYAHFDSDELCGWVGEMGHAKDRARHVKTRAALSGPAADPPAEAALRSARMYGAPAAVGAAPIAHPQFGLVIASCEGADLRPGPHGVTVYDDRGERLEPLPPPVLARADVVDELCDAADGTRAAVHTGEWGRATLEACLAILTSARENREIALERQVALTEPPHAKEP
jgi:phthalate 4,5-cis-dihydrodiol dehydrogenase